MAYVQWLVAFKSTGEYFHSYIRRVLIREPDINKAWIGSDVTAAQSVKDTLVKLGCAKEDDLIVVPRAMHDDNTPCRCPAECQDVR